MTNSYPNNSSPITIEQAREMKSHTLAFIGDSVHSLIIRCHLGLTVFDKGDTLHNMSTDVVRASYQAKLADSIMPIMTEIELDVFKKGRNSSTSPKSKSYTPIEYNKATGLECLIGFLYLTGQSSRIVELLSYKKEEELC